MRKFLSLQSGSAFAALAMFAIFAVLATTAQAVTVVEYYNTGIDAHFLTGRDNEKQALDGVATFKRTGMTFQATDAVSAPASLTKICRFYISVGVPYTSSHFYGRQGVDCESILAAAPAGFSYEGFDFAVAQPTAGTCPAGTSPVYRGFRVGAGGKTSNHRYTTSQATYAAAIAAGYVGEGAAFCATSVTDITPASSGGNFDDCFASLKVGDTYVTEITVGSYSILGTTIPGSVTASRITVVPSPATAVFNGRVANRITTTTGDNGLGQTVFEIDTGTTIQTLGYRDTLLVETVNNPPIERPKTMTVGQSFSWTTTQTTASSGIAGTVVATSTQTTTFRGREAVSVPAGSYPTACKFEYSGTASGSALGIASTSVVTGTNWSKGGLPLRGITTIQTTIPGIGGYTVNTSGQTLSATVAP